MRDWPKTKSHFTRNQNVCIVKEVNIPPGQRTVFLIDRQVERETGDGREREVDMETDR